MVRCFIEATLSTQASRGVRKRMEREIQLIQEKLRLWISRPISILNLSFGFFFLSLGALAVRERFLWDLAESRLWPRFQRRAPVWNA